MNSCNCTLPYLNPEACKSCPNNTVFNNETPTKKRIITRTVEKYDREGIFIGKEIIVEEIEDVEIYNPIVTWDNGTANPINCQTITSFSTN